MAATPRRGLGAWPIRRKLIALVAGPLVLVLVAGVFFTAQSVTSLRGAQRARDLANAALSSNQLTSALDREMAATLTWRGQVGSLQNKTLMLQRRTETDSAYAQLAGTMKNPPGGAWSAGVEDARARLTEQMDRLSFVRNGADRTNGQNYILAQYVLKTEAGLQLISALTKDLSSSAPNAATIDAAATIGALAVASDAAAQESVRLSSALVEGRASAATQQNLLELKVSQKLQIALAKLHATPTQQATIATIVLDEGRLDDFRRSALTNIANTADGPANDRPLNDDRRQQVERFSTISQERVKALDDFLDTVTRTARDQADATARDSLVRTGVVSALALIGLLLGSLLVTYVARSVTVPMRRLRAGAVDAATVRLPAMVRQIEREGSDTQIQVPAVLPPGTNAGPETLEVAQAVDGLTAEAIRLATAQVRLRHALDEAFVSMSRRSQSMVEKQLAIIDELESTEEDPDQLRNLFRLDHLAARMRRYNDNLLVLAGSTLRTRSAAPVPIADVFRAATSEMEQYERVRLQPVNGISVSGPVAGGLVHLLAELLDNAAMYSPPTSPILLAGTLTPDGGLHLEITDSGVGIPASELADLNARLASPGNIDTQVPSRMGLYVVGRLAQRGSFAVRLAPRAQAAGTVAEVDVPAAMVVGAGRSGPTALPGQGPGGPGGPGGAPRPDLPRLPGQPLSGPPAPGRSPAPTGGMRLDPALRLTNRPGGTGVPPRSLPAAPEPGPAPRPGEQPLRPAAAASGPGGFGGPGFGAGGFGPGGFGPGAPAPEAPGPDSTPAAPAAGLPGRPANGAPAGLPSRRPGAALASNPLASRPGAGEPPAPARTGFEAFGMPPGSPPPNGAVPSAGTAAAAVGGVAAARAGLPPSTGGPSAPPGAPSAFTGAPATPYRPAAPPQAPPAPPSSPFPPLAPAPAAPAPTAPRPLPPRAPEVRVSPPEPEPEPEVPVEAPAPSGPRFEAPHTRDLPRRTRGNALAGTPLAGGRPVPTPLAGIETGPLFGAGSADAHSGALGLPGSTAPGGAEEPAGPDVDQPFGQPFGRPFEQAFGQDAPAVRGGLPSRPPYRPGASTAQAGATAATAAAAAARARAAAGGRTPTPGTGLFAVTGPATLPGGIRPSARVPLDPMSPLEPVEPYSAPAVEVPELLAASQARSAAALERVAEPDPSLIGEPADLDAPDDFHTPIFDSISVWFANEEQPAATAPSAAPAPRAPAPVAAAPVAERPLVIDLRDTPAAVPAPAATAPGTTPSRWAALGDQRWLATNARAASAPEIAGNTEAGLPRRQPGANLLPSAVEAAPGTKGAPARPVASEVTAAPAAASAPSAGPRPDADAVRGRLGSYQRGLTTARRARHLPGTGTTRQALGESESRSQDAGHQPGDQGGNQ